ncbi:hypothetical protein [Proteus vulgaris]|uniref:hypothetical protein n=1 Tax=Proteus vulgaris TaxID=585 RepID=UPI0032DA9E50
MEQTNECNSRNIPLPIQREVRQRCGFGCVICGMPLYEYEHMEGWAKVKRHVANEITLLCDRHHREKTAGLLPIEMVKEANKSPFNLKNRVSKPYNLHFSGDEATVEMGSNNFKCNDQGYGTIMVPVSVDGIPLIGFILTDGHLLLNIVIFDEFNQPILHIKNNQLFYSISPWDIQLVGKKLTIREAHKKILLEIQFLPPNKIVINRGRLLCNGVEILIRPTNILITNNATIIQKCSAINCYGGLIIGHHNNPIGGFMSLQQIPRYLGNTNEALIFEKTSLNSHKDF